jgi:hypothetical protein
MIEYSIVKNHGRSGWLIDDGSGTSIRYPTKAEAERTIAKWQRAEQHRAEQHRAELDAVYHTERLERVRAYLVARTLREAENAKQLVLL